MEFDEYIEALDQAGVSYKLNQPLAQYGGYGSGGNAAVMVFPKNLNQIKAACRFKHETIGNGTNVLFSDYGYDGAIINVREMNAVRVSGVSVRAECGATLAMVREAAEMSCLGGLEFTEGIPATIGGAVCMNAGCFSKSVGDLIAYVITDKCAYNRVNCDFDYRSSRFSCGNDGEKEVIAEACFLLKPSESDIIQAKKEKYKRMRKNSQPHGKSCGSVFLNDGYFAGKLIDLAGLKGIKTGGARVSEKHANFIINEGGSSSDVYALIKLIKKQVLKVHGVNLKEEIKYIGKFDD